MRLAYLTGTWPSPSETFIAREVDALRALGVEVEVFSLWGPERKLSWAGVKGQFRHPFANAAWQCRLLGASRRGGRAAVHEDDEGLVRHDRSLHVRLGDLS